MRTVPRKKPQGMAVLPNFVTRVRIPQKSPSLAPNAMSAAQSMHTLGVSDTRIILKDYTYTKLRSRK
jgi:hypothetical protein